MSYVCIEPKDKKIMNNFDEIMKNAENTIDTLIDEKARRRQYMDRQHKEFKAFAERINEAYPTDSNISSYLRLSVANDYVITNDGEYFRYRTILGIGDIVFSICPTDNGYSFWLTIDGEDEHQYEEPLMKRIAEAVIKRERNVK